MKVETFQGGLVLDVFVVGRVGYGGILAKHTVELLFQKVEVGERQVLEHQEEGILVGVADVCVKDGGTEVRILFLLPVRQGGAGGVEGTQPVDGFVEEREVFESFERGEIDIYALLVHVDEFLDAFLQVLCRILVEGIVCVAIVVQHLFYLSEVNGLVFHSFRTLYDVRDDFIVYFALYFVGLREREVQQLQRCQITDERLAFCQRQNSGGYFRKVME